jgi:hypothetical protein
MRTILLVCFVACLARPAAACDMGDRAKALMAQIRTAPMETRKATGGATGDMYFKARAIDRKHGGVHGRDRAVEASLHRELTQLEREFAAAKAR